MIINTGQLSYKQVVALKKELNEEGFNAGETGMGGTINVGMSEGREERIEQIIAKYGAEIVEDRIGLPPGITE